MARTDIIDASINHPMVIEKARGWSSLGLRELW